MLAWLNSMTSSADFIICIIPFFEFFLLRPLSALLSPILIPILHMWSCVINISDYLPISGAVFSLNSCIAASCSSAFFTFSSDNLSMVRSLTFCYIFCMLSSSCSFVFLPLLPLVGSVDYSDASLTSLWSYSSFSSSAIFFWIMPMQISKWSKDISYLSQSFVHPMADFSFISASYMTLASTRFTLK